MKIGDMVDVKEKRGLGKPSIVLDHGTGLIVSIEEDSVIWPTRGGFGRIKKGKFFHVMLSSGEIKKFHETDCFLI